jgi:hypothetical protein
MSIFVIEIRMQAWPDTYHRAMPGIHRKDATIARIRSMQKGLSRAVTNIPDMMANAGRVSFDLSGTVH